MANRFQRGDLLPFRWANALGVVFNIGIKGKTTDFMALLFDVTNTNHGGLTARIAGKFDGQGNVTITWDADQPSFGPPLIVPQANGIIAYGVSLVGVVQIPVVVEKVHWEDKVESEFSWNFDWKFNTLSGLLVYPAVL